MLITRIYIETVARGVEGGKVGESAKEGVVLA